MKHLRRNAALFFAGLMLSAAPIAAHAADKPTLAFVVNGASDFWKAAEAGMKKAQGELPDYKLELKYPDQSSVAIQQRLMDDLVTAGVKGIMVSAVDPKTSTDGLNKIAAQTALFTTDSDAPQTKRIAYIGSSNVDAGKQAAEIAKKAMPNGGKCMGFVGLLDADNAKERIQGFKDGLEGHQDHARRRTRRRHRPDARQEERRRRAGGQPRHQLHGRLLLLQHAAHLRGAQGCRQARPDHRRRLR